MKNRILLFAIVSMTISAATVFVSAKQLRIRSQISPTCGTTGSLKFADIYADGNIAVMGSYNCRGVFIFDVSNPDVPTLSNWYNPTPNQQFLEAIVIGNRGYFGSGSTSGGDGVHIVDLSNPASPVLMGKVNSSNAGFDQIHEMMVFDQAGKRYLLENSNFTSTRNLRIIDVTNPASPVLKWDFLSSDGGWVHAMHIRGNRMYLSGFVSSSRVDIYDIASLASQTPALLGSIAVGGNSNHSAWTNETGEYLYSARELSNGDLRVYDVRNPAVPMLVKTLRAADLNLNAITPHNPVVMGNKLYVAWYQAGVQVFDITDPTNPIRSGQYDTYQAEFAPTKEELEVLRTSDPWDIMCGAAKLEKALPTTYGGNWAVFPFLGENKVLAGDLATGLYVLDATSLNSAPKNPISDFDGDRKSDLASYSAATGSWTIQNSGNGFQQSFVLGNPGDVPVPADYDGDALTEPVVWRPSNGGWYRFDGINTSMISQLGTAGDIPVPGDYDADGKADVAVFKPSTATWQISQSLLGSRSIVWGANGDRVVAADFDGDGKADLATWRPSTSVWNILLTSSSQSITKTWGATGDVPMVTDFNGDGRSELTMYRPSNGIWHTFDPASNLVTLRSYRFRGFTPVPADYDGDGKTDFAMHRAMDGLWYRIDSSDFTLSSFYLGQFGDQPLPAASQLR